VSERQTSSWLATMPGSRFVRLAQDGKALVTGPAMLDEAARLFCAATAGTPKPNSREKPKRQSKALPHSRPNLKQPLLLRRPPGTLAAPVP
jgi:hypothetical protein